MEIYNLYNVATVSQLRSTVAAEIRKNANIDNPKVFSFSTKSRDFNDFLFPLLNSCTHIRNLIADEAEFQQHQKLEKLYVSTRAAKHFQRDIVRGIEGYIVTGHNIQSLQLGSLRSHVGLVSQDIDRKPGKNIDNSHISEGDSADMQVTIEVPKPS